MARLLILILLLTLPGAVRAQGCIMCKQAAAASPAAAQLNIGILILLVPAITLFIGIIALLYQAQRNLSAQSPNAQLASDGPQALDRER